MGFILALIGVFILYGIIQQAVKTAVTEALHEFKEDIVKKFDFKKIHEDKNKEQT